jgi:DNA-binding LacI/PurR family transcriptional regulator
MRQNGKHSKSQVLKEYLRREMLEYRIPIGAKLPPEAALMTRFSVSRGTIQRVLADLSAEGFLERQQGRGTFRIGPTRSPARACERSMLVGVWFSLPAGFLFGPIAEGIREELGYWGYHAVFEEGGLEVGAEGRGVASLVRKPLDGFIVAPSSNGSDDHGPLLELIRRNVPVVMVDRTLSSQRTDLVTTSHELGSERLVTYLIQLGHRRIGFIGVPGLETIDERCSGLRLTMQRHGLDVDPDWVKMTDATATDCGRKAAADLLALPANRRPTAVFGANDFIAETFAIVAREQGVRVPEDISVVGFDDVNPLPGRPAWLTTYAQPKGLMGQQAARLLMKRIQDPSRDVVTLVLEGTLVVRGSAVGLGKADDR